MEAYHQECALACKRQYAEPEDVSLGMHSSGVPMLVFEGTDSSSNWLRNIDIFSTQKGVHRGFWKYAMWCINEYDLLNVFRAHEELILTGHSLGAAAAVIVRYILRHQKTRVRLILFGCPKVGTEKFRSKFHKVINLAAISFIKEEDVVGCVPCGCPAGGYVQIINVSYIPFAKNTKLGHSIDAYCNVLLQS